ncbi:dienelactone hydrolase family protein [Bradyrhizobium jicamae]|uniref:Dienelactone hydrolase family protein n=1 Tax=Bradyrhizobium jicamae TaxID=280332 RepID=A0ABS5FXR9_9BRAD|nr:dienelactone hydrolase family protein [Bradyrhizobium jicamae]MBR0801620.1 dienelactone hydrolase family protein [Bradyrhizobium jicamae]MBR0933040.1 dienelactone hydrolase family protein [Bradyrhizobium jicamae]
MSRLWSLIALAWFVLAVTSAAAETVVNFPSLDGTTDLIGHLTRPEGEAPRPAVVMMHGCSGLNDRKGRIFAIYRAWARALAVQGYVTLVVDSATPRGLGQTCSRGPDSRRMWHDRPKDAYGALRYLQAQPFVKADHVALMGWSQGGGVTLLTVNDRSIGRPAGLTQDFRTAVSFYPGACADRYQSKPYTDVEPNSWTTKVPLLVLIGEADVWTPFKPCDDFIAAAKARGNPVELKSYPGAVHAFDAPNLPRTELPQYRMHDGSIPVIGTDPEARKDAFPRVLDYLKMHLE